MIKNYFKSALRSLWKSKTTSFINVTCLTVGMTTVVLILLWVQNELTYDKYHTNAKQIFRVTMHHSDSTVSEYSSLLLADAVEETIPAVEKTARLFTASFYNPGFVLNGEKITEKKYAYVDEGWFNMFDYDVLEGTTKAFGQNPFSLILTKSSAKKYFGNKHAIGEFIQIDSINYEVKAVLKDNPTNSSFQFDIWLPNAAYLADPKNRRNEESWGSGNYLTFIQLQKNADLGSVGRQLNAILNKNFPGTKSSLSLLPLSDIHFENSSNSSISHGNKTAVLIFTIMALLILLTASINYITLTTAKAGLRAKEVSVRKIMGAKRKHLFSQFIFDSFVICVIALVLTLVLVHLFLPLFNSITEKEFLLPLSSATLWAVFGLTLVATLLFSSIYPAVFLSRFSPLAVFRGKGILSSKKGYFFKSLIVIQFTLSIALIISTVVISQQLNLIQQADKSYNRSQIFSVTLPIQYFWFNYTEEARVNLLSTFKQRLLLQPGIEEVSVGPVITDIKTRAADNIDWDGRDRTNQPVIASINTDADFQKMFNLQIVQGRWFNPNNKNDEHNFILSETAVQEFRLRNQVEGQRFVFSNDTGRIIGVVKDFHYSGLRNKIAPLVIYNKPGRRFGILIKAKPGSVPHALQSAKDQWKKLIPTQPFNYSFLDEMFESLYSADKKTSALVTFFAIITIVISALGLFGLAAFSTEQRVKEIGIRKVLGASVANIVNILSQDFLKLIALAFIISCPIALVVMHKWLEDFAYRVPISWWVFAVAGLAALLIALITVSFQAIRAAVANPVNSLRTE
jgi:putative ABC transport system permease protein